MVNHPTLPRKLMSLALCLLIPFAQLFAQCNVNDKYDKIISGYHSSIALKNDGTYSVWGAGMQNDGSSNQLSPQGINPTNYTALTGSIYKAAIGGTSGTGGDQAILLTSDGLWAWGGMGNVLNTSLTKSSTFARIKSPTGGIGSNSLGLPTGVSASDVQSMFATYQTLIILTKMANNAGGNVYILTQTSGAAEANGDKVTNVGLSSWKQVKINSGTYLSNVTAVRGQVGNKDKNNNFYNAFIALTSSGDVYTWGNTVYLGDGSGPTAKSYATKMSLPTEFSNSIPKMIGVTGGIGSISPTKNTYYLLSNAGNLYALGENNQRQCGDFTTTERTSWVQVKKSSSANDYLNNINFFSCQEHNSEFPAVAAINTNGELFTWGNNSSGMVGRTDNGALNGSLNTDSFDPGLPVGFSGKAVSVEMGGHTMVYLKEGSSQFCYVGHQTKGSMGDGSNLSVSTFNHNCSSTPSINICGSVPTIGSIVNSTISVSKNSITADGSSTSVISIQLKDENGNNLTSSGGVVSMTTTSGTLGDVVDNNNGTYTVILTSSTSPGTADLSFTINGSPSNKTAKVDYTTGAVLPLTWVSMQAFRQNQEVKITWTTATEVNVKDFQVERSLDANKWEVAISNIPAMGGPGNNYYQHNDSIYNPKKIFYRVRQRDIDGTLTYSPIRIIPAVTGDDKITVYPIPAHNNFHLIGSNANKIKTVRLMSINGALIKTWNQFQSMYDISEIPSGNYIICIQTSEDVQYLKLLK